jgi:tRNA-Thr(GGU) m(6)t(6)A37 methyltransferase TsaA
MRPVALLRTPFPEKFGVPRQSGLIEEAEGCVEFLPEFASADFVRGIEGFSHLWLVTAFHLSAPWNGAATVRPPRLGGNERLGIFATRSPNRPNPIGLSLVRLVGIEAEPSVRLRVSGVDAVDGTPVLDIKPYLPWCEARSDATADWAAGRPEERPPEALAFAPELQEQECRLPPQTFGLISRVLRLNPKPAYHDDPERIYGMTIAGWNVRWTDDGETIRVVELREDDVRLEL